MFDLSQMTKMMKNSRYVLGSNVHEQRVLWSLERNLLSTTHGKNKLVRIGENMKLSGRQIWSQFSSLVGLTSIPKDQLKMG